MKSEDFGPVFSCKKCSMAVQYVQRRAGNVCEEMLTGGRHHCAHEKNEPLPRYIECVCGVACIDKHGQRYDLTGKLHKHDLTISIPAPQSVRYLALQAGVRLPLPARPMRPLTRADGFTL
jgi:hypothetical protein